MDTSSDRILDRIGAACGIVAPVLLQLGFGLRAAGWGGAFISPTSSREDIARTFSGPASGQALLGDFLQTLGSMLFIVFTVRLWATLRRAEGDPGWLSATALVAAIIFNAGGLGAQAAERAIDSAAGHGLDTSAAVALVHLNGAFFVIFGIVTGLFMAAVALVILRWHALPAWLGWSAAVIGAVNLVGRSVAGGAPGEAAVYLFIFWILAASVVLLIRPLESPIKGRATVAARA